MLEVIMIGCGATRPEPNRAVASCALRYRGRVILLDCGEGTQTAARKAGISLVKTDMICLTHYHGDHLFGVPGLLQTMAGLGRVEPVMITGPQQDYDRTVSLLLQLAGPLPFEIIQRPLSMIKDRLDLGDGLELETGPLNHRVPCIGYRFTLRRPGRFLPEKAIELKVEKKLWGKLQKGQTVLTMDGKTVLPQQVMGPERKGLTLVYATDTAPCASLTALADQADLLICDATYASNEDRDKAALYGHNTFCQCARTALEAHVKKLWLTHYGGALTHPEEQIAYARDIFPETEAGYDGKKQEFTFE